MAQNLYRDEINTPEYPTKLEHDLGVFENEISQIIKNKFLISNEITLNRDEDAKLRLFFAIMGFRSLNVNSLFVEGLTKNSKRFYSQFQKNGDFVDLWKRNLSYIVCCRSIDEVINHPSIDDPFKIFFIRDTVGIIGMHFVVAERKNCKAFIIGDAYPVVITGIHPSGIPLHLYSIFPISPNRVIFMVSNGAENTSREVLGFRQSVLRMYPKAKDKYTYTIRVKKLYGEEVTSINNIIFEEAKKGVIFKKETS